MKRFPSVLVDDVIQCDRYWNDDPYKVTQLHDYTYTDSYNVYGSYMVRATRQVGRAEVDVVWLSDVSAVIG